MSNHIRHFEYPIYVLENMEYWEAKKKFSYPSSMFSVWTMIAVKQGRFAFSVGSVFGEASSGDVVLIPPNTPFSKQITEPLSFFLILFFYSDVAEPSEKRFTHLLGTQFNYLFRTPEQDRLLNNFRQLLSLYEQHDKRRYRRITHYVYDIWLLFCKDVEARFLRLEPSQDTLVQEVKDWIDNEAHLDIKLRDIAQYFGLQPVQLTRRFQKAFGTSPSRYLYTIRIEKAKALLIETDYTLDHIAQLCGYQNGFYFSRIFTQYTKMNPSAFRRIHTLHTL